MNDGQLSSTTKAMIEAARSDAPSAAARAKVWSQVSGAVGAAGTAIGGAAGGAAAGLAGGSGAAKLLTMGALLGGTLTVGLAVAVLKMVSVPNGLPTAGAAGAPAIAPVALAAAPPLREPQPIAVGTNAAANEAPPSAPAPAAIPVSLVTASPSRSVSRPNPTLDPLAREAQLVAEARGALGRGDPRRALQAVRAARALPSHQLAPEELAVEAQALRALGRANEATAVDETLRSQFPESALAR
jgi:hypothetical protein